MIETPTKPRTNGDNSTDIYPVASFNPWGEIPRGGHTCHHMHPETIASCPICTPHTPHTNGQYCPYCYDSITHPRHECPNDPHHIAHVEYNAAAYVVHAMTPDRAMKDTYINGRPVEQDDELYCTCGAFLTDDDELCADCACDLAYAESGLPSEHDPHPFIKGVMLLAALFVALTTHTASASPACTITGTSGEGFPVATCDNGSKWMRDMDGQIYENAAGAPIYPPGTWVPCTVC